MGQAPYVLLGICLALVAAVPAFADPSIDAKRAEAQSVMGQLQSLSDSLERARSQYDAATVQLARTEREQRVNAHELAVARADLRVSQRAIRRRLVTLYTTDQDSTIEVILGARSLDDLIARIDSAKNVTNLDSRVAKEVAQFKTLVVTDRKRLAATHAEQAHLVAARAAAKASIESKIGQQQRLLSSIKGQIAQMIQAEQARQLQAAREQAQARILAAHQQAQQAAQDTVVGVTAAAPDSTTVMAPPPTHGGVVGIAMSQLGTPYVWGGAAPGGFDCSGLVMWAYAQVGVSLPHSTYALYAMGVPISRDELEPGDLVFFDGVGHVGIYIGGGQFIHAPHTGDVVKISSLDDSWYAATYVGARRIL